MSVAGTADDKRTRDRGQTLKRGAGISARGPAAFRLLRAFEIAVCRRPSRTMSPSSRPRPPIPGA